jgi:hypothetical protein
MSTESRAAVCLKLGREQPSIALIFPRPEAFDVIFLILSRQEHLLLLDVFPVFSLDDPRRLPAD